MEGMWKGNVFAVVMRSPRSCLVSTFWVRWRKKGMGMGRLVRGVGGLRFRIAVVMAILAGVSCGGGMLLLSLRGA